jgi:hypothetical protein
VRAVRRRPGMSPTTFDDLDRRERRRLVERSALRIVVTTLLLIALYLLLPDPAHSGTRALIELVLGLILFAALLGWHVQRILSADHPELRAVEALAASVPVLILVFAYTYLSLYRATHASFSEPLDHMAAVYFTVSVLSTVGFGDIVAKTDVGRLLVTIQILLDLIVVVGIVRTLLLAARIGVRRQTGAKAAPSGKPDT